MWDLVQKFDFEQRSLIKVELDYVRNTCNSISNGAGTKFLWLHLAVMGFSIAYMVLTFNYFLSIMSRFRHIRELHKLKFRKKTTPYSSSLLASGGDVEFDTLDEEKDDVEILKQSY